LEYCGIGDNIESTFLNWKDELGTQVTASLAARTGKKCEKMEIGLKQIDEQIKR
jgi:hypothetical protein